MAYKVLIVHAEGDDDFARCLAEPISAIGYEVAYNGTLFIGESIVSQASKYLNQGGPIILCGTIKAIGTSWARRIINAAYKNNNNRIFPVKMESDADVDSLLLNEKIANYWLDQNKAIHELIEALTKYYPIEKTTKYNNNYDFSIENKYRDLLLQSCDIINLANLPEQDRNIAHRQLELRRLYVPIRVYFEEEIIKNQKGKSVNNFAKSLENKKTTSNKKEFQIKKNRIPIGECLEKTNQLVILGDPGAGKTTLLRWIATAYLLQLKNDPEWQDLPDVKTLPNKNWTPIIIRCRDFNETGLPSNLLDLLKFILKKVEISDEEKDLLSDQLRTRLVSGLSILMIDGLDEITDTRSRINFCQLIENIYSTYNAIPIIVTSRIVGYREMGYRLNDEFRQVKISDLNNDEKDDFVKRWCNLTELPDRRSLAADELIHDIHSTDRIERLTGNPMLLTTMALVKRKVGKLPSRRAELYWEAVQVLLNWRRDVDDPIDTHEAIPQLEYLAYAMCNKGVQQIRSDEILDILTTMRNEYPNVHIIHNSQPIDFLRRIEARTGLIIETGYIQHLGMEVPVNEFRHLTFQEYLAARALVDGRFPDRNPNLTLAETIAPLASQTKTVELHSNLRQINQFETTVVESWREALRLCTSICLDDDVDSVVRAIATGQNNEQNDIARARAILAFLCIADEPNISEETAKFVFKKLILQIKEIDCFFCSVCVQCENLIRTERKYGSLGSYEISRGPFVTGIDTSILEIIGTHWANLFYNCLIEEFNKGYSTYRRSLCGAAGLIGVTFIQLSNQEISDWLNNQICVLSGSDRNLSSAAAITIMEFASQNKIAYNSEIVRTLLNLLSEDSSLCFASSIALYWINNLKNKNKSWHPTADEILKILQKINTDNIDPDTFYFLTSILIHEREFSQLLPIILNQLNNSNVVFRLNVTHLLLKIPKKYFDLTLMKNLINDTNIDIRRISFAFICKEKKNIDLSLITRTNTSLHPPKLYLEYPNNIIDPAEIVTVEYAKTKSMEMGIPVDEVMKRYEKLSSSVNIQLEWKVTNNL